MEMSDIMTKFSKQKTALIIGRWQPWHKGHRELFKSALERAENLYLELIQGKKADQIHAEGDKSALEIPDTLMTLTKVREYIGPSLMQVAKMLQPGEFTAPKKVIGGYKIIILLERRDASPPKFEFIRERVKSEYQKRKDDQALRDYLNKLKKRYEIDRNSEI